MQLLIIDNTLILLSIGTTQGHLSEYALDQGLQIHEQHQQQQQQKMIFQSVKQHKSF